MLEVIVQAYELGVTTRLPLNHKIIKVLLHHCRTIVAPLVHRWRTTVTPLVHHHHTTGTHPRSHPHCPIVAWVASGMHRPRHVF